jgi:outer membrane protein assembly factor BamB
MLICVIAGSVWQPILADVPAIDPSAETVVPAGVTHLNNDVILRRWLRDGRARLDAGKVADGLTLLQRILDRGDDGFVRLQTTGPLVAVRFEALKSLSSLSPNDRVIYEKLFGTQARQLFERAKTTGHPTDAMEASRRFFHTAAGFDAARWLAVRWLDQGESRTAARMWERLLAEPAHQERITAAVRMQAAMAFRAVGQDERANEVLSRLNNATLQIAGESRNAVQAAEFVSAMTLSQRDSVTGGSVSGDWASGESVSGEWLLPTGSATRNAVRSGSVPWLNPLWSASLIGGVDELVQQQDWLKWQESHPQPLLSVACEPVVVRDQVVVREAQGISAFALRSGRAVWRYRTRLPLADLIRAISLQSANDHDLAKAVQDGYASNSALGTLATDGRFVFAVEAVAAETNPAGMSADDDHESTDELLAVGQRLRVLTQLIALPIASMDGASKNEALDEASRAVTGVELPETSKVSVHETEVRAIKPAWILDGSTVAMKLAGPGSGAQFLGSPVVVDGCLYVIAELFSRGNLDVQKVGQFSLLAIDAQSGELLWGQGLALVDQPFYRTDQKPRRNPVGSPSVADGMLICPLELGRIMGPNFGNMSVNLIVGVDLVTGRQRWVYQDRAVYHNDPQVDAERLGGLPSWPVIHRGCVVWLPRGSEHIHCLDLLTGQLRWKVAKADALAVGAVTDEVVLLLGPRDVRAIPFSLDGQVAGAAAPTVWTQRLGMITGRGVRVGEQYLVPLKSGRVAQLELATGHDRGLTLRRTFESQPPDKGSLLTVSESVPFAWPGNLIAAQDIVLSQGPSRLVAYPQARAVLASLPKQPTSIEQKLKQAELSMLLGAGGSSIGELQDVLKLELPPGLRLQAEQQLRESLYLELDGAPQQARTQPQTDALLAQLAPLAKTVQERARLLKRQCEVSLLNDPLKSLTAARELTALPIEPELEPEEHEQLVTSVETWARGIHRQVRARLEKRPDEADRVNAAVRLERDELLGSRDLAAVRRFAQIHADWPLTSELRFHLAELLVQQGEFQEAELLLIRDRLQNDPQVAAAATVRLLRLWDHVGLHALAANLLSELEERFGDVELLRLDQSQSEAQLRSAEQSEQTEQTSKLLEKPLTGREFVAAFSRDSQTWAAFARRQRPNWDVQRVVIREDRTRVGSLPLVEAYDINQNSRRFQTAAGTSANLFSKPASFGLRDQSVWQIVDKDSSVVVGQIDEMDRVILPSSQPANHPRATTHFLPLSVRERMRGASLLEHDAGESAWERPFLPLKVTEEFPRVGPYGPSFCAFQSRQHLIVVDPANGRTLWHRANLEPQAGLFAENQWGLFGDQEVLVLFNQDFMSYTAYETATGRELRRGKLNIDLQQHERRVFGRKLVYFTPASKDHTNPSHGRRMRLWDPLTDTNDIDEPYVGRPLFSMSADGELVIVSPNGRIRVIDVHDKQMKLDVNLPAEYVFGVNAPPRVFSDHDRYYVNLQRSILEGSRTHEFEASRTPANFYLSDSLLPKIEVQGELYAFARPSVSPPLETAKGPLGKRLWTRLMPQRTFLRFDQTRLPFLVALSRQQDRQNNNKASIRCDTYDAQTGNSLGTNEHILPTRFVQTQFDVTASRLTLRGTHTNVTLDFGKRKQRVGVADQN